MSVYNQRWLRDFRATDSPWFLWTRRSIIQESNKITIRDKKNSFWKFTVIITDIDGVCVRVSGHCRTNSEKEVLDILLDRWNASKQVAVPYLVCVSRARCSRRRAIPVSRRLPSPRAQRSYGTNAAANASDARGRSRADSWRAEIRRISRRLIWAKDDLNSPRFKEDPPRDGRKWG